MNAGLEMKKPGVPSAAAEPARSIKRSDSYGVVGEWGRPVATQTKAEHWRSRAAEALAIAEQMTQVETKATMLCIADGYEKMAKQAEENEAALRKIGAPRKPAAAS
jgi:hypothetical protein